jgi:hypothetical protein
MATFAMEVLVTFLLLIGFGFLATASAVWFFQYRKPQNTLPTSNKHH